MSKRVQMAGYLCRILSGFFVSESHQSIFMIEICLSTTFIDQ
ncbi:hypothetical protein EC179100_1082 [Escherichia coli 179100]|nr:hypothetical protein EC179100_1082 [Escherichia coli 179100]